MEPTWFPFDSPFLPENLPEFDLPEFDLPENESP
jgi:hypothetical protein